MYGQSSSITSLAKKLQPEETETFLETESDTYPVDMEDEMLEDRPEP
jgi:hypothetical protein